MSGSDKPPPYYGQHPPPPTPMQPGFAYVPTPVYLPAYPHPAPPQPPPPHHPPNSTYITNIYQHPPVVVGQPYNHQVEPDIDWVQATPDTAKALEYRAFVAGKEAWDGSPLWVIRTHYNGDYVPGKFAIKHRAAYIPYNGQELQISNFEVLCTKSGAVQWMPSNGGRVPTGAIPAGNTVTGEPLYIARVSHQGSLTPGKVHPSHGCCYISFGGREIQFKNYEVLCQAPVGR